MAWIGTPAFRAAFDSLPEERLRYHFTTLLVSNFRRCTFSFPLCITKSIFGVCGVQKMNGTKGIGIFLRELRVMLCLVRVHWSIWRGCFFTQFSHCITQWRKESNEKQIPPLFRVSGRSRNASISVGGEAMSLERNILCRKRWDGWQGLVWYCSQARRSIDSKDSIPITLQYYQSINRSFPAYDVCIGKSASYLMLTLVKHSAMSSRD